MSNNLHIKIKKHNLKVDKSSKKSSHKFDCQFAFCKAKRGEYRGKNSPSYIDGRTNKTYYCIEKECTSVVARDNIRCRPCATKKRIENPKNHPNYIDGKYSDNKITNYCIEPDCNEVVSGEGNRCCSCAGVERWKNEEFKRKTLKAIAQGIDNLPNKPEKSLIKLLSNIFPKEYKYVGDYNFWIEKCNPDFININGQKKIIEFYGDYWHANPNKYKSTDKMYKGVLAKEIWKKDKKRLKTFSNYGYSTLVIWEHELKDLDDVLNKIKGFLI